MSEQLTIKTSGQLSNELAAVNLVSKLMAITLDELKRADKPWSKRSATDQDDTIGRIADGVRAAVRETIEVITFPESWDFAAWNSALHLFRYRSEHQ